MRELPRSGDGRRVESAPSGGRTTLEEFKARLPIGEIVGRYVRLSKRGRDLWGCCPFHNEKSPSFHVVVDKGYYHCFGCEEHGNAIDFVMAVERLEFKDALRRLSELTGIAAPSLSADAGPRIDKSLFDVNARAASWFASQLIASQGGQASEYLQNRGLDREIQQQFAIGYAPPARDSLLRAMRQEDISEAQLLEVGLIAKSDHRGDLYDRFRDRVIFPIADEQGRIRGFGGRALSAEATAKYLNTAETSLFKKGHLLYGLDRAAWASRQAKSIIVAEGYLDVIALVRAGYEHAVAPLGTAITEDQLQLLWRYANIPTFCLDGDAAGLKAAARAATRALPLLKPGKSLSFCLLDEGEDPDSLFTKHGAKKLQSVFDTQMPLVELLWRHESAQLADQTPEARALLERRLHELAGSIADRTVSYQYQTEFRERLRSLWRQQRTRQQGGHADWNTSARPNARTDFGQRSGFAEVATPRSTLALGVRDPDGRREGELLAQIIANPWLLRHIGERLLALELRNEALDALRQELIEWFDNNSDLDGAALRTHLVHYGFVDTLDRVVGMGKFLGPVTEGDPEFVAAWVEAAAMFEGRDRYRRGIQELEQRHATAGTRGTTAYLNDLSRWGEIEQHADIEPKPEPEIKQR